MSEENGTTAGATTTQAEELVEVVFNNRTVKVPASTRDILLESERDMKRGMSTKMEEAATLRKQLESQQAALREDIEFYKTHDMSDWDDYQPKINGGQGYVGTGTGKKSTDERLPGQDASEAFAAKQTIAALESRLQAIESTVQASRDESDAAAHAAVNVALGASTKKYPLADIEAVTEMCVAYFAKNKKHPSPDVVEGFAKKSHDRADDLIKKASGGGDVKPKSALPDAGGTPQKTQPDSKVLRLGDDSFLESVIERIDSRR